MSRSLRVHARRFLPIVFGAIALALSFFMLQVGLSSKPTKLLNAAAISDQRQSSKAATRGATRTAEAPLTAIIPSTASSSTVPSSTAVPAPTTSALRPVTAPSTIVVPTTALVTTSTAAPTVAAAANGTNSQTGGASYYLYKPGGCAHKTLPKGTVVTVTNLSNGKSTTCVVNDRGPYVAGRIIDLDTRVFEQVASTGSGVFNARISW